MNLKRSIFRYLGIPSSWPSADYEAAGKELMRGLAEGLQSRSLPGTQTLAEVVSAPQDERARPVCGGDPFISDPCPVKDCKLGCDEPY